MFNLAKSLVCRVNSIVFFGPELGEESLPLYFDCPDDLAAQTPEFLTAACQYPRDVFLGGEILQLTPSFLAP